MIKIRRNCKEIEGRSLGIKRSSKARKNPWSAKFRNPKGAPTKMALGCEIISQPQGAHCEIKEWLRKWPFAAKTFRSPIANPCENFRSCEIPHWHTSAISQPSNPISQLRNGLQNGLRNPPLAAKWLWKCPWLRNWPLAAKIPLWLRNGLRNPPLAVKSPFCCKMASKLQNGCEITSKLRNGLQATKLTCEMGEMVCENTLWSQKKLRKCQ